jgi:predicted acetyltransferase
VATTADLTPVAGRAGIVAPMAIEIRRVREDELVAYFDAMSTGFLARPDVVRLAEDRTGRWDFDRVWGAFDGDRIRGTFRTWSTELTVPGGAIVPAAAVTGVTVMPTHRRRGLMRGMTLAEHGAARERGEVAALLYAAEYTIYGRFGYGPACREGRWTIDVTSTGFVAEPRGGVDLVTPTEETRDIVRSVFDSWRARQAGEIRRRDDRWDLDLGLREDVWDPRWKGFVAVHRDGSGGVDGYARYRSEDKWERGQPRNVLVVDELHALTDDAYLALWRFLAEIDWVATVRAERRTAAERLPWLLTNARAAQLTEVVDGMWVRLFDLRRALEARTYEREGRFVLEIVDAEAPDGRVRLDLDAGPDGATARKSRRSPDLTVDVSALGAAYLGGIRLRDASMARGADEHRAGALAGADALLRTVGEPWCSTFF